jgi:hypothetical protein
MVAIRYNSDTKRFYERLLQTAKHKKVALTACIRKIVTALNAMLRDSLGIHLSLDAGSQSLVRRHGGELH